MFCSKNESFQCTAIFLTNVLVLTLNQAPLFCNVKCTDDHSISFPLYYHTLYGRPDGEMSMDLYVRKRQELLHMGTAKTWDQKIPKLFFSSNNKRGHRGNIFEMESPYIEAVNHNVPMSTYGEYRYAVYTYGHSGWSARLRELTFMNATIFMEESSCKEFFAHFYEADTHFVALHQNLSNLPHELHRANEAPVKSRQMAIQWLERSQDILSLECILEYIDKLIRAYAKLQRFEPQLRDDWPEHHINSTVHYFLRSQPPDAGMCQQIL